MDSRFAQPLFIATADSQHDLPRYPRYKFGPHNPSSNGSKLYECTRIKTLAEERERIQKKTFTKWSNTFLKTSRSEIEDLFTDLCDGRILLNLIEAVSGYKMPLPTPGRMRIHCLENVEKSLAFLDQLNVHLENVGAHDVVDGNSRIILGLIWTIILRFQIQSISVIEKVRRAGSIEQIALRRNSTEALLLWCKAKTQGYPNVHVANFSTSWRDGLAFCALIHKHSPEIIDFGSLSRDEPLRNLHIAFTTADRCLGIAKLLDPEDLLVEEPDERSIITYLVTYYHYFSRAKANTVHVRRIERVIYLLRKFINGVKDYEVGAGNLLAWIHLSIERMNDRRFKQNLEGLQNQLVEFNQFRTQEKPPHFYEKGDIEVSLFVIRSEMIASGMRTYTPPQSLQLSEINKAWEILEQAEHSRCLAINDELMQLEMLEQLFVKFETKCAMRESWLEENQQIAEQTILATTHYDLQVALKKHEALEADVYAYEDRVQLLRHIATELQHCGYFRTDSVVSRCTRVLSLWSLLLETLKRRRTSIFQKLAQKSRDVEFDHLVELANALCEKIDRVIVGETYEDYEYAKKTIEAYDTEVKMLFIQVDRLLSRQQWVQEFEATWMEIADQLMRALEVKRNSLRLKPDVNRLLSYTRERIRFLMGLEFRDTYLSTKRLQRQIKMADEDVKSKQLEVDACRSMPVSPNDEATFRQLLALWDGLLELITNFKEKATFLGNFIIFAAEMDDVQDWLDEKMQILQMEEPQHVETAAKRNEHLLNSIETFIPTLEKIGENARTFASDSNSLHSLPFGFEASSEGLEKTKQLRDLQSSIEARLAQKPANLTHRFHALLEAVKQKQAAIIDKVSIVKFVENAALAEAWISDKGQLLEKLKPVDVRNIYEEGLSNAMQENLACILRRYDEFEKQMSAMADRVTNLNKAAANIVKAAYAGHIQNAEAVLSQVSTSRNNLNDAWNQLADAVEDRRLHFNLNNAFITAGQDCLFTATWIEEKLTILMKNNWVDIRTVAELRRLECLLNSLQSDARVIRAKVDDIGERVLDIYPLADAPLNESRKWLCEQHEGVCAKMAELEGELDKCRNSLAHHGSQLKSAMSLDEFQQWLSYFKDMPCCFAASSDNAEVSRALATQEQNLLELVAAEKQLEKLLKIYESLAESDSVAVKKVQVNPEQVIDDYGDTCDLVRCNIANLHQIINIQAIFAEASSIELLMSRQDVYLLKEDRPNSVEATERLLREHDAFVAAMAQVRSRLRALDRRGRKAAANDAANGPRIITKLDCLNERLDLDEERAHQRGLVINEEKRLQDLLSDAADIEDWMAEKLEALKRIPVDTKRDVVSVYNQVKAQQEEIESSRERAEGIIETGRNLIDSCPRLDDVVTATIDYIVAHWEDLLKELHARILQLEESRREYMMNGAIQELLRWAENVTLKAKSDIEDSSLVTAGLTELQKRLEAHQTDCQEFEHYASVANAIKEDADSLSQRYPQRAGAFGAVVGEIHKQLDVADDALAAREDLLNLHQTVASHLLDLTSELLWVKDKLVHIRQPYSDWQPQQDRRFIGAQLLRVHQARRRLTNHITEVENRGPRVKRLCIKVKETYLGGSGEKAGPRLASFREVLGELEKAWYTATHLLEVRREELRLADAIHKFCFDALDAEAWISERELYLQGLQEPTNIEEANRALRRLNVLQEAISHWSSEVVRTSRRGSELQKQLGQSVEINGDQVAAPPAAKEAVSKATKEIGEMFSRLQVSVSAGRFDLMEAITLHDVMQDIEDLEDWIASRHRIANSNEVGDDLEHCYSLQDRFVQFSVNTQAEGNRRIRAMLGRVDQLILCGHKNRAEMALGKDNINEAWADLMEMIETRKQLLTTARAMHNFLTDTQYLEELILECHKQLPAEPTVEMVTGRATPTRQGIASLQRTQAALEQRLGHINQRCISMNTMATQLLPQYAGDQESQLRTRRNCVLELRTSLVAEAERRTRQLDEARRLYRFFITARSLLAWMDEKKEEMSHPNELSRTIYAVERLIAEHRHLYSELGIKIQQAEECLNVGREILEFTSPVSQLYATLTAPRGEVREVCILLATERIITEAMWRERWERIVMLLDARYFLRDASAGEAWLVSREVYLVSTRRAIGETLADTLALLGAHYAFEKACASAEERFAALKRLTKLEIRALEWTPEDAKRHEQEKRKNIREAVHEFIPPTHPIGRNRPPPTVSTKPPTLSTKLSLSRPASIDLKAHRGPTTIIGTSAVQRETRHHIERQQAVSFYGSRTTLPPVKLTVDVSPPIASVVVRTAEVPQKITSRASLPMATKVLHHQAPIKPDSRRKSASMSSTSGSEIYFPKLGRASPPRTSQAEPEQETIATLQEAEKTISSTQQQGSFPSTSAKTPESEQAVKIDGEIEIATTPEMLPRVEGPLIRKQELDAGGVRHTWGRGWSPMYVTLEDGKLSFYRDLRTRRERPDDIYHGEAGIELRGARAAAALDYTKRQYVFRLRAFAGAEYLFQAVSEEVLLRWVGAINEWANALALLERPHLPQRAFSLPPASRHSRASSANSSQQSRAPQKRHSSLRRVFKRN